MLNLGEDGLTSTTAGTPMTLLSSLAARGNVDVWEWVSSKWPSVNTLVRFYRALLKSVRIDRAGVWSCLKWSDQNKSGPDQNYRE